MGFIKFAYVRSYLGLQSPQTKNHGIIGKILRKSNCHFLNELSIFSRLKMTSIWKWYPTLQKCLLLIFQVCLWRTASSAKIIKYSPQYSSKNPSMTPGPPMWLPKPAIWLPEPHLWLSDPQIIFQSLQYNSFNMVSQAPSRAPWAPKKAPLDPNVGI